MPCRGVSLPCLGLVSLESGSSYASDRLYLEGGSAGVTCEDVVNKKTLPQALQEELLRSRGQDVVGHGHSRGQIRSSLGMMLPSRAARPSSSVQRCAASGRVTFVLSNA